MRTAPAVSVALLTTLLAASPALAWIPKLDAPTARNVIDAAYRRSDPVTTYLTADLSVQAGKFATPGAVKVYDAPDTGSTATGSTAAGNTAACLSDWLSAPTAYAKSGSRPVSLTFSGQADQLSFQAAAASDSFKTLTPEAALKDSASRMPDGQIRLDLVVAGLSDLKQRSAYLVRLRGPGGKLIAPVKSSYVNDWKPIAPAPAITPASTTPGTDAAAATVTPAPAATPATSAPAAGPLTGTLVYYFEPTKAGINANDKVDVLVRTEAASGCAYAVSFDLGKFY